MKVTANIEDKIIKDAMRYSNASTITEALKTALKVFISIERLKELSEVIKKEPLTFNQSATELRTLNREI